MNILKVIITFWRYILSIIYPSSHKVSSCSSSQIFLISNGHIYSNRPKQEVYPFYLEDFKFICSICRNQNCSIKKAMYIPTGKMMAVKILLSKENYEEVNNLRVLENGCDHIVEFYGSNVIKNKTYIFMELMDFNLKNLIDCSHNAKISLKDELLACIAVRITKALEYCAEHNIIHRDVKPLNILLSWKGKIKLGDFGDSKYIETSLARSTAGTILYWPPEIFQNIQGESYDNRVDVWALGITLLECIHGNLNFISNTYYFAPYQSIVKKINNPAILIHYVFSKSNYSDDLKNFISKCVALINERATINGLRHTNLYEANNLKCDTTICIHLKQYQKIFKKYKINKKAEEIQLRIIVYLAVLILLFFVIGIGYLGLGLSENSKNKNLNTTHTPSTSEPTIPNACYLKCPDGWTFSLNSTYCYKGFSINATISSIDDAVAMCNKNNAHLASIHNKDENNFITNIFDPRDIGKCPFFGLTFDNENQYQWKDNSPVDFLNFPRNYSNSNNLDSYHCFRINLATNMHYWEKSSCINFTGVVNFVCKQSPRNILVKTSFYEKFSSGKCPSNCTHCQGKCLDGWTYSYTTHQCYKMVYDASPFYDAEEACKQVGAHLLSVHNDYENSDIVKDVLLSSNSHNIWIGISYDYQSQNFTWSDTSNIDYSQWEDNEPDINKGYCVYRNFRSKWQTHLCDDSLPFICKKNPFNMY